MSKQNKTQQHTLDRDAQNGLTWFCGCFGRDQRDAVNGIIAGSIEQLRAAFDETTRECSDNSAGVIEQSVIAARARRLNLAH
jgi:hypothetical protein